MITLLSAVIPLPLRQINYKTQVFFVNTYANTYINNKGGYNCGMINKKQDIKAGITYGEKNVGRKI